MIICSKCLSENDENDEFCLKCGSQLKKDVIILKRNFKGINILAVFIGTIIWIVLFTEIAGPHLINTNADLTTIASTLIVVQLISSAVAGYIGNSDYKNAAVNGGFLAIIPAIILAFYIDVNSTIVLFFIFLVFGILGGISGRILESKFK